MSNPENPIESSSAGGKPVEETPLSEGQSIKEIEEAPLLEEKPVEEGKELPKAPEPLATGDERITILKHDIYRKGGEVDSTEAIGIGLTAKNVSDKVIGSVLFEAELYDMEGNILDTVEHKEYELLPNASRTLRINYLGPEVDKVKSYHVRVTKTVMTPEPSATGNEKVNVIKHGIRINLDKSRKREDEAGKDIESIGVDLAIRNVSNSTIATVIFEVLFYDIEGNILDTVKHKEFDMQPSTSRAVVILASILEYKEIKSYNVGITRTVTADVEKVQLRRHEIIANKAGEEEINGVFINISEVKTDAALVAAFYDPKKENIGTKVLILRDIEPHTIHKYHLIFKPQEGDIVRTYTLNVGEIVE
ncbi:hypothetical protein ACFLUX_01020 [Chloroflexota bacterium]